MFAQLGFQNTDLDIRVDATFKGEEQLFLCSFILCVQISSAKVWHCFTFCVDIFSVEIGSLGGTQQRDCALCFLYITLTSKSYVI